jgi:Uma2 family endonuclease
LPPAGVSPRDARQDNEDDWKALVGWRQGAISSRETNPVSGIIPQQIPPRAKGAAMKPAPQTGSPPPLLRDGERLTQKEFHRRYLACPEGVKAELIGGVVYMGSPLGQRHGMQHVSLSGVFWLYQNATPGVIAADNATAILSDQSEPQPDLTLRIGAEYGGQARVSAEDYLEGAPELIAEVSNSRTAFDLGAKRNDYQQYGVQEYLVVCIREREIHWFDFRAGDELRPRQGIYRSRVFPGLWIDGAALLAGDGPRLTEVVRQGTDSRAHAAFVSRLAREHRRLSQPGGAS